MTFLSPTLNLRVVVVTFCLLVVLTGVNRADGGDEVAATIAATTSFPVPTVFAKPRCWEQTCRLDANFSSFFLLGDTGGIDIPPHRSYSQEYLANTLGWFAWKSPVDFVLNAGDNIYSNGVKDVDDPRFQDTFEEPYKSNFLKKNWYIVPGNHDHFGNISAQIAYTEKSDKWTMPAHYYKISYQLNDGTTFEILALDTIQLCGNLPEGPCVGDCKRKRFYMRPANVEEAEAQWAWLEANLRNSTADYLFVMGHYPVWSLGTHGPTRCLINRLVPLLTRYDVTAYMSGHDHCLQHLSVPVANPEEWQELNFIVSGAGSRTDNGTRNFRRIPKDSLQFHNLEMQHGSYGAFVYAQIDAFRSLFHFHNGRGDRLYTATFTPRSRHSLNVIPSPSSGSEITSPAFSPLTSPAITQLTLQTTTSPVSVLNNTVSPVTSGNSAMNELTDQLLAMERNETRTEENEVEDASGDLTNKSAELLTTTSTETSAERLTDPITKSFDDMFGPTATVFESTITTTEAPTSTSTFIFTSTTTVTPSTPSTTLYNVMNVMDAWRALKFKRLGWSNRRNEAGPYSVK